MHDQQTLPIALASALNMLTVLIGILVNNARLSDMNARLGDINIRLGETHARITETNARVAELRSHMNVRFDEITPVG